jgi:integrase/recombinase XerC
LKGPDVVEHTHEILAGELRAALDRISLELRDRSRLSVESEPRVLGLFERFGSFVGRAFGAASLGDVSGEHVEAFVRAATSGGQVPSIATMRLRRSALRLLFRTARELGLVEGDPTVDLVLPSRTNESARPLTDDEVDRCRLVCLHDLATTRLSVAWALGEATARTAEIPHVTFGDVDLSSRRVWLRGSAKTEPRWGELTK